MSKIALRCPRAKIFDNSVNFVNSVCNKKICPYVLLSKNLCSHSMSKLIFCEFCGFCVCQKDCGRKILRPYSFAPLCVKQKICPYVLLSKNKIET